uniref:Transmembrane protein n=1 Tax=Heterorhabditis bacteriophora TaxID=37862 RepID=A0A1I7WG36_HETBA
MYGKNPENPQIEFEFRQKTSQGMQSTLFQIFGLYIYDLIFEIFNIRSYCKYIEQVKVNSNVFCFSFFFKFQFYFHNIQNVLTK